MLLDGDRHVAEHRRAAGSSYREKVRETWHLQPQIGAWSGRPGVVQAQAVTAHDAHPQQRAGHCVEAGCEYDDVEFVFPIRSDEHTSELQSLMRISYAVFCLKKKKHSHSLHHTIHNITSIIRTYIHHT